MTGRAAAFHCTFSMYFLITEHRLVKKTFPKISFRGFKLDFMEEGVVSDEFHCHSRKQWRETSDFFQRFLGGLLQESKASEKNSWSTSKPIAGEIGNHDTGVTLAGFHPDGEFQPPRYLLGKQNGEMQVVQETLWVNWWQISDLGIGQTHQSWSITGPGAYQSRIDHKSGSLGCSNRVVLEFVILRNTGLAKSGVRTSGCLRSCWMRSLRKLSLETVEQNRAGSILKMPFWE